MLVIVVMIMTIVKRCVPSCRLDRHRVCLQGRRRCGRRGHRALGRRGRRRGRGLVVFYLPMGLPQELLLLVVDLEDAFEADERHAADDRPLKVGVDALEEQLADDGGDRRQDETAANGPCERHRVRVGRIGHSRRARQVLWAR